MSLPAASAPVAVLVLAWDETTPAARVLVEAAETPAPDLDSVAVLVPAGPPPAELTQEEFLPLEASAALPEPPTPPEPLAEVPAEADRVASTETADLPPPLPSETAPADLGPELASATTAEATVAAARLPAATAEAATAAALVKPALVWQAVRVLRLGTNEPVALGSSLGQGEPTFVWRGALTSPAAPYLGSSELVGTAQRGSAAANPADNSTVAATLFESAATVATALVALRTLGPPISGAILPRGEEPASTQIPAYLPTEPPAAPDAEPDTTPTPVADEPVPTAEASTTELSEEAAEAEEPFTIDVSPVQAAPPTSVVPPVPLTPAPSVVEAAFFASTETAAPPELAALRPPARPLDAPNLNFQIIQYARLAVPRALAEQPFGVIYAPAWPTWLAAQELRQRSGQPLVLHIAKLAAADDEPLDLAAGWVAELQRQALHRADLILTETPALAQRLRHELALPTHRVRAVPAADAAAVAQALRTARRQ